MKRAPVVLDAIVLLSKLGFIYDEIAEMFDIDADEIGEIAENESGRITYVRPGRLP